MAKISVTPTIVLIEFILFKEKVSVQKVGLNIFSMSKNVDIEVAFALVDNHLE